MSDKIKKENALIKLKLIHVVLAIFLMLIGAGFKYWSKTIEAEPISKKPELKEGNSTIVNLPKNKGNVVIGDKNNINNGVINNDNRTYNLAPKGNDERSYGKTIAPTKKKINTNYFNKKYSGDIAVIGLANKNGFSNELKAFLSNGNFKTTTSFFRSSFLQDYKVDIWDQGTDILESFKIQNNINCACLVKEQVEYREMEQAGGNMVAEGNVDLQIININSGESTTISISTGGSGFDKADAYKNMQTNFSKELTLQNQLSKFKLCKK